MLSCIVMVGARSVHGRNIHKEIQLHRQSSKRLFPLQVQLGKWFADVEKLKFSVRFEDEGRFGRITKPSACWAPRPLRPLVPKQAIREYTYAYAAVAPLNGEIDSLILPDMYASTMQVFIDILSKRHQDEYILLIMDGASSHRAGAKSLSVPSNIRLLIHPAKRESRELAPE
jgi:hypothetical protein